MFTCGLCGTCSIRLIEIVFNVSSSTIVTVPAGKLIKLRDLRLRGSNFRYMSEVMRRASKPLVVVSGGRCAKTMLHGLNIGFLQIRQS